MKTDETVLGGCPECDESIPRAGLLVRYQRSNGTMGIWAECPGCGTVVHPNSGSE